jgi:hypothetical protein
VKFYLTGDPNDIATVQGSWPNLGFSYNPQRPQLNGGFQISFDGIDWTTFSIKNPALTGSVGAGDQNDPSTWILLPASAIGSDGQDGTLGPYDQATFYIRFVVPRPRPFLAAQHNMSRARASRPGWKALPVKRPGALRSSSLPAHTAAFIHPDPGTLDAAGSISRREARAVLLLLLMLK